MTTLFRRFVLLTACVASLSFFSGCDINEGPAEEAGEAVDEAVDDVDAD